jgi:GTP cyclohydrolase I
MNAPDRVLLADLQASADKRQLTIQQVGIKGLRYPLRIQSGNGQVLSTIARLDMSVGLPPQVKGTHMSRFVEIVEADRPPLTLEGLREMLSEMLARLGAESGQIGISLPYFVVKRAPVSGVESLLDVDVELGASKSSGGAIALEVSVRVPVTSLCPCSKEISDYGAHSQRSEITIRAELRHHISIEELVRLAEEEASCELYGLLKRPDEKFVTERAYDNPKFVEDLVRDIALRLKNDRRIVRYTVESENFESIHNHSAYARIEGRHAAEQ